MPATKTKTTTWSLVLSRWKHVAPTSVSSFTSLQMGRLYERQNCLLQSVQVRCFFGLGFEESASFA